jgi:hypothetical protein
MKTKRGIYLDLQKSTYLFSYDDLTFHFSSLFYLNNFIEAYENEINRFNLSAQSIYKNKFQLELDKLALIRLYAMIEKRGFYILLNGDPITCLENITFELEMRISS